MKTRVKILLGSAVGVSTVLLFGIIRINTSAWSHGFGSLDGLLICALAIAAVLPAHLLALTACIRLVRTLPPMAVSVASAATPLISLPSFIWIIKLFSASVDKLGSGFKLTFIIAGFLGAYVAAAYILLLAAVVVSSRLTRSIRE